MKKFIASLLAAMLLVPSNGLAMSKMIENMPEDTTVLVNLNLSDYKKEIIDFIEKENQLNGREENEQQRQETELLKNQLDKDLLFGFNLDGSKYITGLELASNAISTIKSFCDDSCPSFENGKIENMFEGMEAGMYLLNLDDSFLFYSNSLTDLAKVKSINEGKESGIGSTEEFQTLKNSLHEEATLWGIVNYNKILTLLRLMSTGEPELDNVLNSPIIQSLSHIGFSAKRASENSISLKIATLQNKEIAESYNYKFSEISPNTDIKLYKELPNKTVIFYAENGGLSSAFKVLNDISIYQKVFEEIKRESDIDVKKYFDTFSKNTAFAVQRDDSNIFPYLSFLAEISGGQSDGAKMITQEMFDAINKEISNSGSADLASNEKIKDGFYKLSFKPEVKTEFVKEFLSELLPSRDGFNSTLLRAIAEDNNNNIVLYYGLYTPALFVISNDSSFEGLNQNKLGNNSVIASSLAKNPGQLYEYGYLNMEVVKKHYENAVEKVIGRAANKPKLSFYNDYYSTLNGLSILTKVEAFGKTSEFQQNLEAVIAYNLEPAYSFENFINSEKAKDSDQDGISDFNENYIYLTDPNSSDTDRDGVDDQSELSLGENPVHFGKTFRDVSGSEWYSPYVNKINARGGITGYEIGDAKVFRPERAVNRAEFTKMLVETFDLDTDFVGYNPFVDVSENDWYMPYAVTAYNYGVVNGRTDSNTYDTYFDGGKEITRAEALVMLSRAANLWRFAKGCAFYEEDNMASSDFQVENYISYKCENAIPVNLSDIDQESFYATDLLYAYELGIMTGSNGKFNPNGTLNRAEAAKILSKALEAEIEYLSNSGNSFDLKEELIDSVNFGGLPLIRL